MLHARTGGRFMCFVTKAAMVGIVLTATTIRPAWAELSPPPVQPALDQAIEQYIRSHPEVIVQALQSLELKRQEEERIRLTQAIATNQKELLEDPASPVSGNVVDGGVTVIEFFDYRCGYCKRVAGTVTQLQKDEPGVRVVYKNFPILGDAAKKLEADMHSPDWQRAIDRNSDLARRLGISGTPGFVVGKELQFGALDLTSLKNLVARARMTNYVPENRPSIT